MKRMGSSKPPPKETDEHEEKPWWKSSYFQPANIVAYAIVVISLYLAPKSTVLFLAVAWLCGWFNNPYKRHFLEAQQSLTAALELVEQADEKCLNAEDPQPVIRQLLVHLQHQTSRGQLHQSSSLLNLDALTATTHGSVKEAVLTSQRVKLALEKSGKTQKDAIKMYNTMAAKHSARVLRVACWIFKKLAAHLFPLGIIPHALELQKVKEAARKGLPMVLLPTHKSHMDYLTVHHLCVSSDLAIPHVVAGDNLNIPLFGRLLKSVGAMFIRRTFAGDVLYTAIFNEYMKQLLVAGHTLECFIEGGRSRSGKLMAPRTGFLRNIVDAVDNDDVEDVLLIPMNLSYDKIVESDSHIAELQGGTKQKEALGSTLKSAWQLISGSYIKHAICYGRVDIGFGPPLSTRQLLEDRRGTGGKKEAASYVAYRVLFEMNQVATILPTALVGTILLNHSDRALQMDTLVERVRWLRKRIRARNGRVLEEKNVADSVQEVVVKIMGSKGKTRLVKRHKGLLLTGIFSPQERMELSTYRNQLIHLFTLEGFLACSIWKILQDDEFSTHTCQRDAVLDACRFLSYLLKLEFIFRPIDNRGETTSVLEANFDSTVQLWLGNTVGVSEKVMTEVSTGVWKVQIDTHENPTMPCYFTFVTHLFHPFIESYYIMVLALFSLLPNLVRPEGDLINYGQMLGEKLFFETHVNFFESIAKETLQNALRVYLDMKIIEVAPIQGVNIKAIQLCEKYKLQENLEEFLNKVAAYRKKAPTERPQNDIIQEIMQPNK